MIEAVSTMPGGKADVVTGKAAASPQRDRRIQWRVKTPIIASRSVGPAPLGAGTMSVSVDIIGASYIPAGEPLLPA
jgi:hypothetical protein